jgi:hypothetical protein
MNIITSGIDIELSYAETLDLIELLAYTKQKARNKDPEIYNQADKLKSEIEKELEGVVKCD